MKLKRMITARKEKTKRESERLELQKIEEEQKKVLDSQVLIAAAEIEDQFNKENNSVFIEPDETLDESHIVNEDELEQVKE